MARRLLNQENRFRLRRRLEEPVRTRQRVLEDQFLVFHYANCIDALLDAAGPLDLSKDLVIELGSAGGITKALHPEIQTTDVRICPGVDRQVDAQSLPFADSSVSALIAKDVLHHLPNVQMHFLEVSRVLKPGGTAAYLEPNWNFLSRLIFTFAHPEPYYNNVSEWEFESTDPMYANQALAFVVFVRDSAKFRRLFPSLSISIQRPLNGLAFILSGGVYRRNQIPFHLLHWIHKVEVSQPRLRQLTSVSRLIVLKKM